ncbi:helix-turn-helix domain-containing protein [Salmonella enterica subsp. houtenae]|nr:helix-turn-helix domain-containing protein [Salmonella enterica subsp. houtenae]EDS2903669.1 helix-turn-helix domain-containing protein [Salmonella enterica subsp. houtenae]EDX5631316.1 helix-turn-helix domain-containing protein [Salmonella enterica subsp. houtenae]EEE5062235.1 helix-turn-helix domain-containing protein [Salmonella enterica subsp. houtenae]
MYFNNVRTYHGLFCFTEDEGVDLFIDDKVIEVERNKVFFLEKNIQLKVKVHKGKCPLIIYLDDEKIRKIHELLLLTIDYTQVEHSSPSSLYIRDAAVEDVIFFKRIKNRLSQQENSNESLKLTAIITYMLLQFDSGIIKSIAKMVKPKTKDKVVSIITTDISKQWTLGKVSELMYISEISLRKKLDAEGEKFMKILTDLRMNHSLKLLTTTEYSIEKVACCVGYNTTSYFIKTFKNYFGFTPKQIVLNLNKNTFSDFNDEQNEL